MVKKTQTREAIRGTALGGAAFVLGIFSIFLAGWLGLITGIVGLISALAQRKKAKTKLSTAALILNIIGIILSILVIVVLAKQIAQYLQQQYPNLQ